MDEPATPAGRRGAELAAAFDRFLRDAGSRGQGQALRTWLALAERWRIEQALAETRGNRSAAARLLGIGRRTLYAKLKKLRLPEP
jgi:DNA-binding NtrC family response regulator